MKDLSVDVLELSTKYEHILKQLREALAVDEDLKIECQIARSYRKEGRPIPADNLFAILEVSNVDDFRDAVLASYKFQVQVIIYNMETNFCSVCTNNSTGNVVRHDVTRTNGHIRQHPF